MPDSSQNNSSVAARLADARLDALRGASAGEFASAETIHKKEEMFAKLRIAIQNALFLEDERKKMWLKALETLLDGQKAKELLDAILRENLRYKKGVRKLKFKKIPERQGEEASGDV
jgi:hypothetical protein